MTAARRVGLIQRFLSACGQRQRRRQFFRPLGEPLEDRLMLAIAPPVTPGLYDPLRSLFLLRNSNSSGAADAKFGFATAGGNLVPVAGDFNGDGLDTVGLYDVDASVFHLRNENSALAPQVSYAFGEPGATYQPVIGDWNGDGVDTVGLFRADTGTILLRNFHSSGVAETFQLDVFAANWKAIAGDWNGDGIDTIGLYDPDRREFHLLSDNSAAASRQVIAFGPAGVQPLAGDWDGDGVDSVGVYDQARNKFSLRNRNSAGSPDVTFTFGKSSPGWTAVAGNWKTSAAITKSGVYTVPGKPEQIVTSTFTWVSRNAAFDNEVGIFPVDDAQGRIGSLRPADRGYAAAALSRAGQTVLFASGQGAGAQTALELAGGTRYAMYLIENSSTSRWLARNPQNAINKTPRAYFSLVKANPDRVAHFRSLLPNRFAWEDSKYGGDGDFNDVVGRIDYAIRLDSDDTEPPSVIIDSPLPDALTNRSPTVRGRIFDNNSGTVRAQARLDAGDFFDVPVGAGGSFEFVAAVPNDGTADGRHTFIVRAIDGAGNVSADVEGRFVLDTTPPPLSLELSPESDRGVPGDGTTTDALVRLVGQSEPGAQVTLNAGSVQTVADTLGQFQFEQVPLEIGPNAIQVAASDAAGNQTLFSTIVTREVCDFESLDGWTVEESGGSPAGRGSVGAADCQAVLAEGDSFLVSLSRSLTIPDMPSVLEITLGEVAFDTSDPDFVKDAFEVALLDAQGFSLLPTFLPGRDALVNFTEGLPALVGQGTQIAGSTILVNLAGIAPGTVAELILRLASDDNDTQGQTAIKSMIVRDATTAEQSAPDAPSAALSGIKAASSIVDFAELDLSRFADITASFHDLYFRTSFDARREMLFVDVATRNDGTFESRLPLVAAITNIGEPAVRVRDADGQTPAGAPLFDLSRQLGAGALSPGETSAPRPLSFFNPDGVPFTFDLTFYGLLNQPPEFTSVPDQEALVGQAYIYQVLARDPEGDPLTFELAAAPSGMMIDPATGRIAFMPAASDLGTHAVTVLVEDGQGGAAEQTFVLTVDSDVPNRPPVLITSPNVDGNVHTLYAYDVDALDDDGDPLAFSLVIAPAGMEIDAGTGAIAWTPTADQLDASPVTVSVSDSRGGTAEQSFVVVVQPESGNHSPIIISQPLTTSEAASLYRYQVQALDPDGDVLTFSLTAAPAGADIDNQLGLVTFTAVAGTHAFEVRVTDGRGGSDAQSFQINVNGNHPPVITSTPVTEFAIPPGDSSPPSGDVDPTTINLRLADGQTQTVAVRLDLPSAGSLVPSADVFLLFDDTGSFTHTVPAVISQFQSIIDQLQAGLPNVHFGFGVGRFEDYAAATASNDDRPFLLNQPIVTTDVAGFEDAIRRALATRGVGLGGDTPEALIEALFQAATGLGFDGNGDGDTTDTGPAGSNSAQVVLNSSGDVPAFSSIDDPLGFRFRMLDVANLPTLPLDTTVERTMNPGSLNDIFQFQGTAGQRLFFDVLSVEALQPFRVFGSSLTVKSPRWSLYDSENLLVARSDMTQVGTDSISQTLIDHEFTLPGDDTYVLLIENTDIESVLNYRFRLTTPETEVVPYGLGTFISGSIGEARERDEFRFTLASPTRLVFDPVTPNFGVFPFTWTLEGPQGVVARDRQFNDAHTLIPEQPPQKLPAGDYRLTISGVVDSVGDYRFRLSDFAAAVPVAFDTAVEVTIDQFSDSKLFRFDAQAGDRIFVDRQSTMGGATRLFDSSGVLITSGIGDVPTTTLPVTGTYTLVLERTDLNSGAYRFAVNRVVEPVAQLIAPDELVSGAISRAGEEDTYSFSLTATKNLYFDTVASSTFLLRYEIADAAGHVWQAAFISNDSRVQTRPLIHLPAGEYHVTISPEGDATGSYSFRLHDMASAVPLAYGVSLAETIHGGSETHLFTLAGAAGDEVQFSLTSDNFLGGWRLFGPSGPVFERTNVFKTDSATVTLPDTGDYRLFVEGRGIADANYTLQASFLGTVSPPSPVGQPITFGDIVEGTIISTDQVDNYRLTVPADRLVAVDVLAGDLHVSWSLVGPAGKEIENRSFPTSEGLFAPSPHVLRLQAGTYVLSIRSSASHEDPYRFRVLDLDAAAPITLGAAVSGEINPATETDAYRLEVTTPGRIFIDNQSPLFSGNESAQLVIIDPQGFLVSSSTILASTPADAEAELKVLGFYTLLVEGELNNQNSRAYQFVVSTIPTTPPIEMALGQQIDSSISQSGKTDVYNFTLTQDTSLYFDAQALDSNLRYTLRGPFGTIVNAQPFSALESIFSFGVPPNPFPAVAGQYTLTIDALGDATPSYRFRVLDAADAAPISLEAAVSGVINPGAAALFRFNVPAAGNFFFDNRSPAGSVSDRHIWRLYDPFGQAVFSSDFVVGTQSVLDAEARLNLPGSYLLLIEPDIRSQSPLSFDFLVRPTVSPAVPLTLNETTNDSIDAPGDSRRYTFSLATDSLLYFDSLTNDSRLSWSLRGPNGPVSLSHPSEDFSRNFEGSEGTRRDPVNDFELLKLPAGDYELTIDGDSDRVGPYQFRLVDARSAVPLAAGASIGGDLSPTSESDLYRFDAVAGDTLVIGSSGFFPGGVPMWIVVDPYGQPINATGDVFDRLFIGETFSFQAPRTGVYTLLVEGDAGGHTNSAYNFSFERIANGVLGPPVADSLALDSLQTGQIDDRSSFLSYSFEGQAGQRVFFDGIQADSGGMFFRLLAPSGQDVFGLLNRPDNRRPGVFLGGAIRRLESLPVANRGPFTLPETGTYQFVVDATEDAAGRPAIEGVLGGAGFRTGALPIVLVATDTGTAFQPDGIDPIVGAGGVSVPLAQFLNQSRESTPQGRGATIQQAISALNSLGAIVIGMGTNAEANAAPRQTLEAISRLTGAVNASGVTFENNSANPIGPGDPFYYQIQSQNGASAAQGITAAILQSLQNLSFDVDVVPSDPSVILENVSGIRTGVGAGDAASFDVRFTGDGLPRSFDLLFVKAGTGVVLGSIPVRINADPYTYDVFATDCDGDMLSFSLSDPPEGASIDPQSGAINFVPTGPGLFPFTVEVSDGQGGTASQSYFVTVSDGQPNQPPAITSSPGTTALVGQSYVYDVEAADQDGGSLRFFLTEAPAGMTINVATGEISWTPTATQLGAQNVSVRVLDAHGGAATQPFQVTVVRDAVQFPPRIVSTPPTAAEVGRLFRYDVSAIDPNLDPLEFDLPVKPAGMVIDSRGGTLVWRPALDQLGPHDVILRVRDGRGGIQLQAFQILVSRANTAPVITSRPSGVATAGLPFVYELRAQDAEDETLAYSLRGGLAGMAIDSVAGLFSWTPTIDQLGSALVTLVATDPNGAEDAQDVLITVNSSSANAAPSIESEPRLRTGMQNLYLYQVRARDPNGDLLAYSLIDAPQGMTIDAAGIVAWQPAPVQLGFHSVSIEISDGRGGVVRQDFTLEVVNHPVNSPPEIVSAPPASATIGTPFAYDPIAVDADHDPLFWSLDEAPLGVSIDPQLGSVRWTPAADQRGPQTIVLRVTDPLGGSSTESLALDVRGANVPPVFATTPATRAAINQPYRYEPRAIDRDGDIPTFSLTAAPLGMTIDGASGVIAWTPAADQLGVHDVTLVVRDGQGGLTQQLYRILVTQSLNRAPEITSTPPMAASVGFTYEYDAHATDPEGGAISFAVLDAPFGMIIDSATGQLSWVPQLGQEGPHTITVQVQDSVGAVASQTFTIDTIADNGIPVLVGPPRTTAAAGQLYRFDVPASDPDGDPLTYRLDVSPADMTIDQLGRILWQTTADDVGDHPVLITIADNRGAQIELAYEIAVVIDAQAPRVAVGVSENPVSIGSQVVFQVRATDDVGIELIGLTVGGIPVALDRNGRGTFLANQAGLLDVVATATDAAGNVATGELELLVRDPSDPSAPTAEITSPSDDGIVTTFTDIIGTVSDDNLLFYTLEIAPADGGDFTEIARGNAPVIDGVLGRFDPTLLANDTYTLRLTAVDAAGNVSVDETSVSIRGNLKIGEFSLSFIDINVPVLGVSIVVARTYSSFDASREQSLGFGWRLSLQDVDLRTNVPKTGDEQDGIFNPFFQNARVYVTLPGGRREGFTFKPKARFGFADLTLFRPEFIPDKGVTSQLAVDPYDLIATSSGEFFGMTVGGLPYNPADSAFGGKYVLTTKEGLKYEIDGISGDLRRVTTPSGETLTYLPDQITSSAGLTVAIGRDQRGRITSVTDPNGHTVRYAYDAAGDLVDVTDRVGNQTHFEYSAARPHFLERVIDPLGRTGIRVEYDAEGRVVRHLDAAGREIEFVNDFANSQQTIVDARGNPTTYEYDDRGNVLTTIDPLGGITRRTYDDNDYELTTTDPLGHTTTRTFDVRGNVLSEADPLGNTIRATYNGFGEVLTSTDPLGDTTTTTFATNGDIRSLTYPDGSFFAALTNPAGGTVVVSDPLGTTLYEVDGAGNAVRELDPVGGERHFAYDGNGNLISETVFRTIDGVRRALTTTFEYDAENRLVATRDPLGNVSRIEYDAAGQETARIDVLGRRTSYEYDPRGLAVRTIYSNGTTSEHAYDRSGNKIRTIDQAGHATQYEYDALNRLVATVYPDDSAADLSDNPRRQSIYDPAGREVATIDENGRRTDYEYDAAGRRSRTTQPEVQGGSGGVPLRPTILEEYDAADNLVATVDPRGNRTEFEHDEMGRVTLTRFADGTTIERQYDAGGRLSTEIDQAGEATTYTYDAIGNLLSVALPAPVAGQQPLVTHYTYDEAGNRLTHTDALGRTTTLTYDELGRLESRLKPSGLSESFSYDAVGNQVSHTDFAGATTEFTYDALDRLIRKDFPGAAFVATTYTPTGQIAGLSDSRGLTQYVYDERERLLSRTEPDGRTISYTYDDAGNRLSVSSAAGTTQYAYDALNRMSQVTDHRGGITKYAYDLAGNLVRTELPNGVVETRAHDTLNRTASVLHTGPSGVIAGFDYTFDPVGRQTSVTEDGGRRVDYGYDLTGRLISETIAQSGSPTRTISYAYDAAGNRTSRRDSSSGLTTYEYDVDDQLLREVTGGVATTYTYDASGNTLSITSPIQQRLLAWNAENRLIGLTVTDASGTHHIEYEYNDAGLRVSQTVDGQEIRFLVDELLGFGEVLEEYDEAGNTLADYTYGIDLVAQERSGQTSYFHADGQDSTRVLTDPNAAATDRYFFEAYGRVAEQFGNTQNPYLYRGEQFDPDLGAYYLRARYLSPASGRFLSVDPEAGQTSSPLSLHRYQYADLDPVNKSDPSGRATSLAEVTAVRGVQEGARSSTLIAARTFMDLAFRVLSRNLARFGIRSAQQLTTRQSATVAREVAKYLVRFLDRLPRRMRLPVLNQIKSITSQLYNGDKFKVIMEVAIDIVELLI